MSVRSLDQVDDLRPRPIVSAFTSLLQHERARPHRLKCDASPMSLRTTVQQLAHFHIPTQSTRQCVQVQRNRLVVQICRKQQRFRTDGPQPNVDTIRRDVCEGHVVAEEEGFDGRHRQCEEGCGRFDVGRCWVVPGDNACVVYVSVRGIGEMSINQPSPP